MTALQVLYAASKKGYIWTMPWDNQQLMPSDMKIEQSQYLEFCLIKAWLMNEHKIFVGEEYDDKKNEFKYKIQSMSHDYHLNIVSNEFDNYFEMTIAGINSGLGYIKILNQLNEKNNIGNSFDN